MLIITLHLTPGQAADLSDAIAVSENVNEGLSDDLAGAAAALDEAVARAAATEDLDVAVDPAAGVTEWADAYPVLTDQAATALLADVMFDAGFLHHAMLSADGDGAEVTVLEIVLGFIGNCWDDQHDGGAHRRDLINANRLLGWLGRDDMQDGLAEVLALVDAE